jgi:hypothetical protein
MRLPEDVAELRSLYLRMLRNERVLLILDNALDGDQVAPLLTRGLRPDRHVAAADRGGRCGVRVDSTLAPEAQHAAVRIQCLPAPARAPCSHRRSRPRAVRPMHRVRSERRIR